MSLYFFVTVHKLFTKSAVVLNFQSLAIKLEHFVICKLRNNLKNFLELNQNLDFKYL